MRGLFLLIPILFCPVVQAADRAGLDFFEQKIRPVLIEHCYECHAADSDGIKGGLQVDSLPALLQGGDSGPALIAGKPAESMLLDALKYETFEMPPSGKLPDHVIADFAKWIEIGAPDPRKDFVKPQHNANSKSATEIDIEAGRKFWAFQPVESHILPEVQQSTWLKNWIDNFVLARLEESNLAPVEAADRGMLIRRIAYDLTGLPPQPHDLERLLYSPEENSIEDYVDQLLSSQQFGEHWGRHWLDVARYADSNGGDFNATFHNAWRYRNYVIETFNQDRPFNEFVMEQIAGDLMDATDDAQRTRNIVATGFLMLGTKMLSERDKEKLRMDVVDEQISSIGKAFMGMTLGCARCHDHKFDPIPTKDYYALAGILRGTQTLDGEIQKYVSNWTRQPLPMTKEHSEALEEYEKASGALKKAVKELEAKLKSLEQMSSQATILKQGIIVDDADAELIGEWKSSTYSKNFIGKGYVHDDRQDRGKKLAIFRANLPVDGEYEVRFAFPGSGGRATNVPVKIAHAEGESELKVDQSKQAPLLTMLKPLGRFSFKKDQPAVVEISNKDADGYVIVDAVQFVPVAELENEASNNESGLLAEIEQLKKQFGEKKEELKQVDADAPPPAPKALAVREAEDQGDYFVCIRGEHRNLGSKVPRGFLQVATLGNVPEIENDQSGRLALAKWVADPNHPLTARVYVNRVWQKLIGVGIVRSVDNFGTLGDRPTHPLLLDQLAVEFIEHEWSTKWLVKQIVLSHTYQLSSRYDANRWQADPENLLLWRAIRKPLPAESIRDTMLLSAEELNFSKGGPPVDNLGTLVTQNNPNDSGVKLESTTSRTLYQPVIRNELASLMRVFDFADPDFVTGQRSQTTVPAQSLWMLNGPFIFEQSQKTAKRLLDLQLTSDGERIEKLYTFTVGRPPTETESQIALKYLNSTTGEPEELWTDLTHAIFASSAFRMLD